MDFSHVCAVHRQDGDTDLADYGTIPPRLTVLWIIISVFPPSSLCFTSLQTFLAPINQVFPAEDDVNKHVEDNCESVLYFYCRITQFTEQDPGLKLALLL